VQIGTKSGRETEYGSLGQWPTVMLDTASEDATRVEARRPLYSLSPSNAIHPVMQPLGTCSEYGA